MKRIKFLIGSHPIATGAVLAVVLVAPLWAFAEFHNGPKCRAIWSQPQLHVWATAIPPFRCMRQPRPVSSPIPSDEALEMALAGGPQ